MRYFELHIYINYNDQKVCACSCVVCVCCVCRRVLVCVLCVLCECRVVCCVCVGGFECVFVCRNEEFALSSCDSIHLQQLA